MRGFINQQHTRGRRVLLWYNAWGRDNMLGWTCKDIAVVPDRKQWLAYMKHQVTLGVPSLYYLTHIDKTMEKIEKKDFKLVRELWGRYKKAIT